MFRLTPPRGFSCCRRFSCCLSIVCSCSPCFCVSFGPVMLCSSLETFILLGRRGLVASLFILAFNSAVKPALSGHLKKDKTKVLMENSSLMEVGSIAECSPDYQTWKRRGLLIFILTLTSHFTYSYVFIL